MSIRYRCMHCDQKVMQDKDHNCIRARDNLKAAITKAVDDYFATMGLDVDSAHMDAGNLFLAYLKGNATFVEITEDGRYEPATCGTDHLIAERVMRVIEQSTMLHERIDAQTIEALEDLAQRAGVYGARESLRRSNPVSSRDEF